jgi:hypothetical protein
MKKTILFLSLIVLSSPCFALFSSQLPQQIVCDAQQFCYSNDNKYDVPGWSLGVPYGYLKTGVYKFKQATLMGNPNDNFEKQVGFEYEMTDKDGYLYQIFYGTINWLVPINKDKYIHSVGMDFSSCISNDISDCYVTLLAPQTQKN